VNKTFNSIIFNSLCGLIRADIDDGVVGNDLQFVDAMMAPEHVGDGKDNDGVVRDYLHCDVRERWPIEEDIGDDVNHLDGELYDHGKTEDRELPNNYPLLLFEITEFVHSFEGEI